MRVCWKEDGEERNALAQSDSASAKRGAIFLVPRGMQIRRSRLTRGRNLLQLRVYVYVLFFHFPNITFTFFYMIPLSSHSLFLIFSSHSFFLIPKIDHFLPVLDRDAEISITLYGQRSDIFYQIIFLL